MIRDLRHAFHEPLRFIERFPIYTCGYFENAMRKKHEFRRIGNDGSKSFFLISRIATINDTMKPLNHVLVQFQELHKLHNVGGE
jgi:hypothetical protein